MAAKPRPPARRCRGPFLLARTAQPIASDLGRDRRARDRSAAVPRRGSCRRPSAAPNVLLISIDTLRADRLGCYGATAVETPAIDCLAAAGVRFENAFTQSADPARALDDPHRVQPWHHGVVDNGMTLPTSPPAVDPRRALRRCRLRHRGLRLRLRPASHLRPRRGFAKYDDGPAADAALDQPFHATAPADERVGRALAWLRRDAGAAVLPLAPPLRPPRPLRAAARFSRALRGAPLRRRDRLCGYPGGSPPRRDRARRPRRNGRWWCCSRTTARASASTASRPTASCSTTPRCAYRCSFACRESCPQARAATTPLPWPTWHPPCSRSPGSPATPGSTASTSSPLDPNCRSDNSRPFRRARAAGSAGPASRRSASGSTGSSSWRRGPSSIGSPTTRASSPISLRRRPRRAVESRARRAPVAGAAANRLAAGAAAEPGAEDRSRLAASGLPQPDRRATDADRGIRPEGRDPLSLAALDRAYQWLAEGRLDEAQSQLPDSPASRSSAARRCSRGSARIARLRGAAAEAERLLSRLLARDPQSLAALAQLVTLARERR